MSKITINLLIIVLTIMNDALFAENHPQLKAFPEAEQGMERFVIVLPHKDRSEDRDFKVELIVGKEMLTDGINLVRLSNKIESRFLRGWGYTYYQIEETGNAISTMMAPPEGSSMVSRFVAAAPLLIPYNSRLPIVVYVPKGYLVKYRLWAASNITMPARIR